MSMLSRSKVGSTGIEWQSAFGKMCPLNYRKKSPIIQTMGLSVALALSATHAIGQPTPLKDNLVGTWKFVSSTSQRDDGSATWGHNPKGSLIFTENGRFSLQIMRSDRPKYKSNTRMRGSLIENQATTRGTLSYFGTYELSQPDRLLTLHIESSSFPNYNDTDQRRMITLNGNDLKLENPSPSRGRPPTFQTWERVK
jgi:Lipocalin-like domain